MKPVTALCGVQDRVPCEVSATHNLNIEDHLVCLMLCIEQLPKSGSLHLLTCFGFCCFSKGQATITYYLVKKNTQLEWCGPGVVCWWCEICPWESSICLYSTQVHRDYIKHRNGHFRHNKHARTGTDPDSSVSWILLLLLLLITAHCPDSGNA